MFKMRDGASLLLALGATANLVAGVGASHATPVWSHSRFFHRLEGRQDVQTFTGLAMFPEGSLSSFNLSDACTAALYSTIDCDDSTSDLMTEGYVGSFDNDTLSALVCEASCESSIGQMYTNVEMNCGDSADFVPGMSYVDLVGMLWSNWNQSCFTDPTTGDNCNDVIAAFPDVTDVSDLPTSDLCSYCNVKKLALMQADAYTDVYDENFAATYAVVVDACNLTVTDLNATTSVFNVTVPAASEANCVSGNTYTTTAGDTCDSIALANHVSAATMFYTNANILNCSTIAAGTKICLPLSCDSIYTVQPNDTCTTIAVNAGTTTAKVLAYNSQLNWNCTNLQDPSPFWGTTLCVSTPGGTYTGQAANASVSDTSIVDPPTDATVARGTTTDCGAWYTNDGSLTCAQICLNYVIAINLFTEANPSLNKTSCDADLVAGDAYCVGPLAGWDWATTTNTTNTTSTATSVSTPSPVQTGITANCDKFYEVASGDDCAIVAADWGITLVDFYTWNPAVGSNCEDLEVGAYVCIAVQAFATATSTTSVSSTESIATPSPVQSGIAADCVSFYDVVSGDGCYAIASTYGIVLSDFYAWNPAVGSDCQDLEVGEYVCVAVASATTITSTPTTTMAVSTTSITTPSPVQSDIAANCDNFYQVVSGDSCYAVASTYGITLASFYSWNPAVGSSCTYLDVGDYVCVGVSAAPPTPTEPGAISTCTAWHYVVSGDGCYSISEEYGITTDDFYTWNTGVGDTCANLYLNYYVCVAA